MTRRAQAGFAYIAAVVFLVVIAGISVALLQLTSTQQSTVNQALLAARASLAARGGIEWVFQNPAARCNGAAPTDVGSAVPAPSQANDLSDFVAESGFRVSVACAFRNFREGEELVGGVPVAIVKRIYEVQAVACNGGGACPDAGSVTRPDYVERKRVATMCLTAAGTPCP